MPFGNVIRGNSTAGPSQGIQIITGSTIFIRNAIVDANNGAGVQLSEHSTATVVSSTITGNTVNGVQLVTGSGVIFRPNAPVTVVAGNAGFDLKCLDGESSITGPVGGSPTSDGCTGF